jgi:hypothetical protein
MTDEYTQLGQSVTRQKHLRDIILHNKIVTPQQLHQWSKRDTGYPSRYSETIKIKEQILFDSPSVTDFWNRSAIILHELLNAHTLLKKVVSYGYSTLDTTPQQVTNYLLVPA